MNASARTPASRATRNTPSADPNPCANSQPRPRPAASPARGANQRPDPDDCGAVAGCCDGGVACFGGAATWRWTPRLRPPPSLAAWAPSATMAAPNVSAIIEMINLFMVSLRLLEFIAPMHGDDARAQVEEFDILQPRPFQHGLQALLVRMRADRLGEIAVCRFVARHGPAQPGQHGERIPVVDFRERRPDPRELEHKQPPGGPEHAVHLRERGFLVGHIAQAEGHAYAIEIVRGERQRFRVALHRRQRPAAVDEAIAPALEHRPIDVGKPYFSGRTRTLRELERQIAGPRRDVEHALALAHAGERHHEGLP